MGYYLSQKYVEKYMVIRLYAGTGSFGQADTLDIILKQKKDLPCFLSDWKKHRTNVFIDE